MSRATVFFEVFDDEIKGVYLGLYTKDLYYVAIKAWFENNTPSYISSRFTTKDIIDLLLQEVVSEQDPRFEQFFYKALEAYRYVDMYLSLYLSNHKAHSLVKVIWVDITCAVHIQHHLL